MLKGIVFFLLLRLGLQRYLHSSRWEMWRKCADIFFLFPGGKFLRQGAVHLLSLLFAEFC